MTIGDNSRPQPPVAIDLGTRYIRAAWYSDFALNIVDFNGARQVPAYLSIDQEGTLFGEPAKERCRSHRTPLLCNIKRVLGRTFQDVGLKEEIQLWPFEITRENERLLVRTGILETAKCLLPEVIYSEMLKHVKKEIERCIKCPLEDVVITIPSTFNDAKRQATLDAAAHAGLNVVRLVTDATAAAIYIESKRIMDHTPKNIFLVDWGAGNLQMSIVCIGRDRVDVRATGGLPHVGGMDLDNRILNYVITQLKADCQFDIEREALASLIPECETVRRELNYSNYSLFNLPESEHVPVVQRITKAAFEAMCSDIFEAVTEAINKVFFDARMGIHEIDEIVLLGGCTKMSKVQMLLEGYFQGKPLIKSHNSVETVVFGATIQAAVLRGQANEVWKNLRWSESSPVRISVQDVFGTSLEVFKRNTSYPAQHLHTYSLSGTDMTELHLYVYEGDGSLFKENDFLGQFTVTGIPPVVPNHRRITVVMKLDENGILSVSVSEAGLQVTEWKGRMNESELPNPLLMLYSADLQRTRRAVEAVKHYISTIKFLFTNAALYDRLTVEERSVLWQKSTEADDWLSKELSGRIDYLNDRRLALMESMDPIIDRLVRESSIYNTSTNPVVFRDFQRM